MSTRKTSENNLSQLGTAAQCRRRRRLLAVPGRTVVGFDDLRDSIRSSPQRRSLYILSKIDTKGHDCENPLIDRDRQNRTDISGLPVTGLGWWSPATLSAVSSAERARVQRRVSNSYAMAPDHTIQTQRRRPPYDSISAALSRPSVSAPVTTPSITNSLD